MLHDYFTGAYNEYSVTLRLSLRNHTTSDTQVVSLIAMVSKPGIRPTKLNFSMEVLGSCTQEEAYKKVLELGKNAFIEKFDKVMSDSLSNAIAAYAAINKTEKVAGHARYVITGRSVEACTADIDIGFLAAVRSFVPAHVGIRALAQEEIREHDNLPYVGELHNLKQLNNLIVFGVQEMDYTRYNKAA